MDCEVCGSSSANIMVAHHSDPDQYEMLCHECFGGECYYCGQAGGCACGTLYTPPQRQPELGPLTLAGWVSEDDTESLTTKLQDHELVLAEMDAALAVEQRRHKDARIAAALALVATVIFMIITAAMTVDNMKLRSDLHDTEVREVDTYAAFEDLQAECGAIEFSDGEAVVVAQRD